MMRKFAALSVLLALLMSSIQFSHAQTRARRVETTGDTSAPPPAPPQTTPTRLPTLGGAPTSNGSTTQAQPRSGAAAQSQPEEVDENEVVRVNTTLVTIPVSVLDRDGKYIPNILRNEFRIWEEGVEQEIAYFATVEKPFTVALVLDTSGSTKFRLDEIQDAAIAFVDQLRSEDRVMVVSFDDQIKVLAEPTTDRYYLRSAIRRTRPGSSTRLYDAVDRIINNHLNRIEGRKAIVLFTDGVDTASRAANYERNLRDAEELDALIYPVQYDTYDSAPIHTGGGGGTGTRRGGGGGILDILGTILGGGGVTIGSGGGTGGCTPGSGCSREEYERGDRYLKDMARATGGRVYQADTNANLERAFALIAEELRRQYSLGYYPKQQAGAGQRRRIKVRVTRPNLVVQARDSYIFQSPKSNVQSPKSDFIGRR